MPPGSLSCSETVDHQLRNQRDPICRTSESFSIGNRVFADDQSRRYLHALIDDTAIQPNAAADVDLRQDDRPIELGIGMHAA